MRIVIAADAGDLAGRASDLITRLLNEAPGRRATLGLAGGSTPRAAYERLCTAPVDWSRVDLWLSDERWVPPDHPDSNGRMARETLADHIPATFHPVPWFADRPAEEAAAEYAATIDRICGDRPDVVLLGMGDDGHTASLFPGRPTLTAGGTSYVADLVPGKGTRLTATVGLLHSARHIVFLVAGATKAPVLAGALDGEPYPATLVAQGADDVTWIVDEAAAAGIDS